MAIGAVKAAAPAAVYVSGTVLLKSSSAGAPPAIVSLDRLEEDRPADLVDREVCLTNGSFLLKAPSAGELRLKVTRNDEVLFQERVTVPPGGLSGLRIRPGAAPVVDPLSPVVAAPTKGVPWSVRLISADGAPASPGPVDAWLEMYWDQHEFGAGGSAMVTPDGVLTMILPHVGPPPPTAQVALTLRHGSLGWGSLRLRAWPAGQETLRPSGGATLKGTVVDRQDAPIPGTPVLCTRLIRVGCVLRRAEQISYCAAVTDAKGQFHVIVPGPGTYDVRARLSGGLLIHNLFWLSASGQSVTVSARDEVGEGALKPPEVVED